MVVLTFLSNFQSNARLALLYPASWGQVTRWRQISNGCQTLTLAGANSFWANVKKHVMWGHRLSQHVYLGFSFSVTKGQIDYHDFTIETLWRHLKLEIKLIIVAQFIVAQSSLVVVGQLWCSFQDNHMWYFSSYNITFLFRDLCKAIWGHSEDTSIHECFFAFW